MSCPYNCQATKLYRHTLDSRTSASCFVNLRQIEKKKIRRRGRGTRCSGELQFGFT
jgi:hypothetical protein